MKINEYLATRLTSLKPPLVVPENPFKLLAMLNRKQTAFFLVAFFAWTWDSFDFFTVTLNIIDIGKTFHRTTAEVTWAITITLMFRSVGAIVFGILGDRFGRKWPFIINILLYGVVEFATGFTRNYDQFIAARAVFGIAMGGIYGNCAATALEDAPVPSRGLLSGILQQGYSLGYILAAVFNLIIVPNQPHSWRAMFWFGGCPPFFIALWRLFLPETETFLQVKRVRQAKQSSEKGEQRPSAMRVFLNSVRPALKQYWAVMIYMVIMMAGFSFLSHGSQDLYPTFLVSSLKFTPGLKTVTMVVSNLGALTGGICVGYFSSFFGRRLSILVALLLGIAVLPASVLLKDQSIIAGAFFEQMCIKGAFGVVPIYLMELSPVQFRSFVVGTVYQLGNLIASPASTIEAKAGQHFPKTTAKGDPSESYDYSKVILVLLLSIYAFLFIVVFFGPEKQDIEREVKETQDVQLEESSTSTSSNDVKVV